MLGLPINVFAFCYCFFVIVFFCIPIEVPVTLAAAKRAPTVWAGVICIALAVYVLHG
jgi:choline transport protein